MQKTNFPIELIIADDASTDNNQSIILDYSQKYHLIKPILRKKNLGPNPNWNDAVKQCSGKYIALCEGDDYWTDPMKLQKQVDILEYDPQIGICYTDVDMYLQETGILHRSVFENGIRKRHADFPEFLANMGYLAPLTWVFRRAVYDTLDIGNPTDGSFVTMLEFMRNSKVYYLNEVTGLYRKHKRGISSRNNDYKSYKQWKGVFETQKKYVYTKEIDEKLRLKILSQGYTMLLYEALKYEDREFIAEAEAYFNSISISFSEMYSYCQRILNLERSASFRLGQMILYPFHCLKNMVGIK